MRQSLLFLLLISMGLTVNAQTVNLRGKVTNQAGKPISKAIVSLLIKGLKDTTDSDGAYQLATTGVSVTSFRPQSRSITLNKGFLDFSLYNPSPVKLEIFDVNGALVKKEVIQNADAGFYHFNVADIAQTTKLLVVRLSIGQEKVMFRYIPLNDSKYIVSSSVDNTIAAGGKLAKIAAVLDTLKVTAANYKDVAIAISTYDTTIDVKADTVIVDNGTTVRLDQTRQTIQGFGINAALMPSGKTLPWDQLFSLQGTDALGLSILRIGMNTNGGLRDVPDYSKARTLGAKIIGSCWSAQASWKDNNNENQGGHLYSKNYKNWADMIAKFAKAQNLYAMSIANESDFASCKSKGPPCTDDYASMVYTAKEMVEFVKVARKSFTEFAPDVKIIAPEASEWIHVWSNASATQKDAGFYNSSDPLNCGCFSNELVETGCAQKCINGDGYAYGRWMAKDTAAWNSFDILGVHEYDSQKAYPWPADVTNGVRTKEVWQTEMSGVKYWPEQGPNATIENGVAVARWIQSALTIGEASAWCYWWYEAYYQNDNEGLAIIQGNSGKAKRYYTMGNYSRYIRPGQKVVNITGTDKLPNKVLLTASKDDDGKVVIVAVNEATSEQTVSINIAGGTVPASFTPYVTDGSKNWSEGTAVSVTGGVLSAKLDKMSVTTFVSK